MRKVYPLIAVAAVVAVLGTGVWYKLGRHPDTLPLTEIQTTENRVPLQSLLQQGKHTLISFWSITCGPCLREIPELKKLHRQNGDLVNIISITMQYDQPDMVLDAAADLPYQVALDLDGELARYFGIYFTPTHLLVGPDGKVLDKNTGPMDFTRLRQQLSQYSSS